MASVKGKGKAVWIGCGDETDGLFEAARAYVKCHGGSIVVIGPIELQRWPQDSKHAYRLAIRFTGKPPKKPI